MRHIDNCSALDVAVNALARRDYVAADRIINRVYASGEPMAWFVALQIGMKMAEARAEDRRQAASDTQRIAS
jgi:hypothetical protein